MGDPRMTAGLVAQVARELDARRGARIRTAHQDGPTRFRLDLRQEDERVDLVIDLEAWFPRVYLAAPRPAPRTPLPLAGALRKRLRGGRLDGAAAVPGERALALRIAHEDTVHTLWIELFGGQANWYLLDAGGRVELTPRGEVARRRDAATGTPFSPMPPRAPEAQDEPPQDPSGSRAVEALWREARGRRRTDSAGARLRRFLKRRQTRAQKAQAAHGEALAREAEADLLHRQGELLRASFHLLEAGATRVVVPDYAADPPAEVEIPLDPSLAPGEQVAACFRREKRCRRAAAEARDRGGAVADDLRAIEEALAALAEVADEAAVEDLVAGLPAALRDEARRALAPPVPGTPKGPHRARPWRSYDSADGWTILVGRDAKGNDELTLHKAAPADLFLHVRGAAGSHVIVPTPRGKTVPKETLLDAAELACHFSERSEALHNEVDHTPRRHVRKPKGSPPGLVVLQRSKTIALRRDDARRSRLLASKTPEDT